MRIAILSLFTEAHEPLNTITEPPKRAYADRWGYTFINHCGTLDEERPPPWSKIRLIQRHLGEYDWIYWIDADAAIMNPAIRLETFLRDYDLIIAQECHPSPFGNRQFNTGSFFLRNRPWSHRFLQTAYAETQFKDHPFWEQAAIRHALDTDLEAPRHVYVETNQRKFNSFFGNYSKGDFVFHAYTFTPSVEVKKRLLCESIEGDAKIADEREPDVPLFFLINRLKDDHQLLLEFGIPSIVENNLYMIDYWVRFLETTPSELNLVKYGPGFGSFRERMMRVASELENREDQVVAFAQPDIQFLRSNWKRRCLIRLGRKDGLFLENGNNRERLGDAFFIVRATTKVRSFFRDAAKFVEAPPESSAAPVDSFAALTQYVRPEDYGCAFDLFPRAEVGNTDSPTAGLEWIFNIVIHSAECAPDREAKRSALESVRRANQNLMEGLRNSRTKPGE